jgi:hypothetical protein
MTTLYETYQQVLNEAVANYKIINAIKNKLTVRFYYDGDKNNQKGYREGDIYAFGESTKGNPVIRVYQLRGTTASRVPEWKMFRVDKIRDMEYIGEFERPQAKFNAGGDNSMQQVYNIVEF